MAISFTSPGLVVIGVLFFKFSGLIVSVQRPLGLKMYIFPSFGLVVSSIERVMTLSLLMFFSRPW